MTTPKALLVTDIVDSTLLAQRLDPDALSALWQAHDHAARELLGRWNGQEIDSSDGFLLMFDDVSDALDYASAYHHALRALPIALDARAGVHFGEVLLRTNEPADVRRGAKPVAVEGIAKPLAARVASLARAGQTLVTADARAVLTRRHADLRDRAWWRLKGVAEPVHLFESVEADAAPVDLIDVEKAWRVVRRDGLWVPLREQPHNLARDRDAFVGRSAALDAVWQAFESGSRCVSLLGLGGVGKTRLAQRFGWARLGDFPGGVWFCDLAAASSPEDVCQAVADVLNVPLDRADAATRIASVLASRGRCLLILDNFEQVVGAAGATLGLWLDRAEDTRFLVTSRDRLGIGGERGIVLQPLDRADAVALFEERAVAARGEPLRTDTDLAAVGTSGGAPGRTAAGDRARRRPRDRDVGVRDAATDDRPVRAAGLESIAAQGPFDAPGRIRLVVGPAFRRREDRARAAVGVRRQLLAAGGGVGRADLVRPRPFRDRPGAAARRAVPGPSPAATGGWIYCSAFATMPQSNSERRAGLPVRRSAWRKRPSTGTAATSRVSSPPRAWSSGAGASAGTHGSRGCDPIWETEAPPCVTRCSGTMPIRCSLSARPWCERCRARRSGNVSSRPSKSNGSRSPTAATSFAFPPCWRSSRNGCRRAANGRAARRWWRSPRHVPPRRTRIARSGCSRRCPSSWRLPTSPATGELPQRRWPRPEPSPNPGGRRSACCFSQMPRRRSTWPRIPPSHCVSRAPDTRSLGGQGETSPWVSSTSPSPSW